MPLFIYTWQFEPFAVLPVDAWENLLQCVHRDPQLTISVVYPDRQLVEYAPIRSGIGPERVDEIASSSFNANVMILATDSNTVANVIDPAGNPQTVHLSDHAGFTCVAPDGTYICMFDSDQCWNTGYRVKKEYSSGWIAFPSDVILFHELSHAYHVALYGDATESTAQTDENAYRVEIGAPRRSVGNDELGCGNVPVESCFVTEASQRFFRSLDLTRLRKVRTVMSHSDRLESGLVSELLAEYDQYSVRIARRMQKDSDLAKAVYWFVVAPLFELYSGLAELLTDYWTTGGRDAETITLRLRSFLTEFSSSEVNASAVEVARCTSFLDAENLTGIAGPPWTPRATFAFIASQIASTPRRNVLTQWAFLTPLRFFWQLILERDTESVAQNCDNWVRDWLAAFPNASANVDQRAITALVLSMARTWAAALHSPTRMVV